jgi:CRISPR-associated protein Cmr6
MYPRYILEDNKLKETQEYVELLTIFPDDSETTQDFLAFLDERSDFELLWPN